MYTPATQDTMYFIGVTTTHSSIMKVFPAWMEHMHIDAVIKGIDLPIHADPQIYRDCVTFLKNDPKSLGALVTTHKIDLYNAAKDLFDELDPYAQMLGEISSISKQDGKLIGHAKDPISSGLALEAFVPENYWKDKGGEVLLFGAGGATLAMCTYFTAPERGDNVPSKITIANRSQPRIDAAREKLSSCLSRTRFEFCCEPTPAGNDKKMAALPEHSLVINGTGLGKDAPGSPITNDGKFPKNSLVWEINYRGELDFMHQAEAQQQERGLTIEDGWIYFIHGWTQVIQEVFHTPIAGKLLEELSDIAKGFQAKK